MQIVNTQNFETQAGLIGTTYNIKNMNSKNELKNILIKLSDVKLTKLEGKKMVVNLKNESNLNVLQQFEEKIKNFIISEFNTSNETIGPLVYTSEAENKSVAFASASANNFIYVRLNNYSSFYDLDGEDVEMNENSSASRYFADCILKFDTITYINNKYYINGSIYQALIKEVVEETNNKILLNFESEFMNNF
jgi:uncharacterized protein YlzI (FlbEa/FlbD family)